MTIETVYKFPIAPIQSAFFMLNQIHPESLAYNIPLCVRLEGELDRGALQDALNYLVQRHEILRTTYDIDDKRIVQLVQPSGECLLTVDASNDASPLDDWLLKSKQKHFDLIDGPLLYADLKVLSEFEHVLLIVMHHITVDHTAVAVLIEDLETAYQTFSQKIEIDLPEQSLQYADYVVWKRENTDEEILAKKLDIWKQRLDGFSGLLNLPTDRPRPAFSTSEGAQCLFDLTVEQSDAIKKFSSERAVSLYQTFLSIYKLLLRRVSKQDDIIVGAAFANRGDQEELDRVLGCFLNTLPLATNFKNITNFTSLLKSVKEVMLEAYDNQEVPFERIVDAVCKERDHSYNPLFQVGFLLQEPPVEIKLSGLKCTAIDVHSGGAMRDFSIWIWEKESHLAGLVWYNTDVFDESTVTDLVCQYRKVIDWVLHHPDTDFELMNL